MKKHIPIIILLIGSALLVGINPSSTARPGLVNFEKKFAAIFLEKTIFWGGSSPQGGKNGDFEFLFSQKPVVKKSFLTKAIFPLQFRHVYQTMLQKIEWKKTRLQNLGGIVSHRQRPQAPCCCLFRTTSRRRLPSVASPAQQSIRKFSSVPGLETTPTVQKIIFEADVVKIFKHRPRKNQNNMGLTVELGLRLITLFFTSVAIHGCKRLPMAGDAQGVRKLVHLLSTVPPLDQPRCFRPHRRGTPVASH